jgi:hypothetical protein
MRSKLTEERAKEAARLVAEGLTLDAVAERLGVHRRTLLRWVARDPAFRARYEEARQLAHEGLYDELREAVIRAGGSRAAAYCTPSGNTCLQAPIDKDVHGNPVLQEAGDDPHVWTGTYPAGNNGGGQLPNCQDWTSDSASDIGTGGNMIETNAGFTTGLQDSCDQSHHVLCVQFGFE